MRTSVRLRGAKAPIAGEAKSAELAGRRGGKPNIGRNAELHRGQPSAIAVRMVLDPDDALFIENERCVQFALVLKRGGLNTNWHLVAARRADKLRPSRPRVEHGDALDRIMQALQSGVRS